MSEDIPLLETVPIFEAPIDCLIRLDRIRDVGFLTYGVEVIDPHVNGGRIFRTPVVRLRWALNDMLAYRGTITQWIAQGPPQGSYDVPHVRTRPVHLVR